MNKYIVAILVGLVLLANGWDALRLNRGAGTAPERFELAALESGAKPKSNYIEIGPHYRLTSEITYSTTKKKDAQTTGLTQVNYAFMPLVSKKMVEQAIASGTLLPDAPIRLGSTPAVLIKTKEFRDFGSLKKYAETADVFDSQPKVSGMLINAFGGLTDEQAALITSSMPELDLSKVLILDVGRTPRSIALLIGLLGGGSLLLAFGISWPVRQFMLWRKKNPSVPPPFTGKD